jgi:sugar lactone lactonase YvrE
VRILASARTFLEAPRWHGGRFWVSDVPARAILSIGGDGGIESLALAGDEPGGIGWMPDGAMLAVSWSGARLLKIHKGRISEHIALGDIVAGQTNDMVVDQLGRAFVGSTGFKVGVGAPVRPGAIARIDPDGSARIVASDLFFPNGMAITPDGRTLVVAETLAQRITAFTIGEGGSLYGRREWARLGDPPVSDDHARIRAGLSFAPDGITMDRECCLWVADPIGKRVVRLREGGEILERIASAQGYGPYSCSLGGADGTELAICENGPLDDDGRLDMAAALARSVSRLVTHRVSVQGTGSP